MNRLNQSIMMMLLLLPAVFGGVVTNETYLNPGENASIFWDCTLFGDDYNGTFYCQDYEAPTENMSYIDIDLSPGEAQSGTDGYCDYQVSCSSCNQSTTQKCQIDKRLDPGEDYEYKEGICDIEFTCRDYDPPDCEDYVEELDTTVEYKIVRANDTTTVYIEDQEFIVNDELEFYTKGEVSAICPIYNASGRYDNLSMEQCFLQFEKYAISPQWYADSVKDITSKLGTTNDVLVECESQVLTLQSSRKETESEYRIYKEGKEIELSNLNIDVRNCNLEVENQRNRTEEALSSKTFWMIIAIIGFFMVPILLLIILILGYFTMKKKKGDAR
jgi:hypothetical protein